MRFQYILLHCTMTNCLTIHGVLILLSRNCGSRTVEMIYELRVYESVPGQADAMRNRFKDEVMPRLPRHRIELVGAFISPIEDGKLTYVTRFADEEARTRGWASFGADPEWKAVKSASEVNGPLLQNQTVSVFSPAWPGLPLG
jgi:hypothetical protein